MELNEKLGFFFFGGGGGGGGGGGLNFSPRLGKMGGGVILLPK